VTSEAEQKHRIKTMLETKIHPIFDARFPGRNRYSGRDILIQRMEPALINGRYERFDRSIFIWFVNEGTATDLNLVVKEWWLFEHDKPRSEVIPFFRRHPVDEKYFLTPEAVELGLVKKITEEIRVP
jgi:hypothetical protein